MSTHRIQFFKRQDNLPNIIGKKSILIICLLLSFLIDTFNQPSIPITIYDIEKQAEEIKTNQQSGLRSITTWKNEMLAGNLLMGKRKIIQTDFYGKTGLLLETEYYNEQGKTDSIATYSHNNFNITEYNLFTPEGEVLKKKAFKYYPDGTIQSIFNYISARNLDEKWFYFRDKNNNQVVLSIYNKNDSLLKKTYYAPDGYGIGRTIAEDGLGNKILEKVYNKTNGMVYEELCYFPNQENNYKNILKYGLNGKVSEIKKENAEGSIVSTIIKKYDEKGNLAGVAYYSGDVVFHSDYPENFDILNDDVKASDKKILKLLQYTYLYY